MCIFLVTVIVNASMYEKSLETGVKFLVCTDILSQKIWFWFWYSKAFMHPYVICRWGFGKEQPGSCALWVDPKGPKLCGGPWLAWGSHPEETLRVWHQDTDEDSGAEPPHPVHSKKVSLWSEFVQVVFEQYTAVWDTKYLQFECLYQMMNPAVSHLITPKQINKRCLVFQFGIFCS